MNQRTAQSQFLFHPAGEFPRATGPERLDLLVYVFHQMVILTYGRTEQRGKKVQVLLHRQVGIQGKPAWHITDASTQLAVVPHNVLPVHRNPPALRTQQSGQHAEQRAFPGSIRSYQSEDFSGSDLERKRSLNLLAQNAGTQKQVDDVESQLAVLKKQLEAQLSTLNLGNQGVTEEGDAAEIQIRQTEDQLEKCRIVSPISGTVLTKYAERGEVTTQGKPLFKVADMKHVFLRAYVSGDQLSTVRLGQTVKVYADYGAEDRKEYKGKITWISGQAEFTPKTIQTRDERANLVYAVKIAVENDGLLKLGMYGEVKFN